MAQVGPRPPPPPRRVGGDADLGLKMSKRSRTKRKPEWYDWKQYHEIPQNPWSEGDSPTTDTTHVQIFVTGEDKGGMDNYYFDDGTWPKVDGKIQLHRGPFGIRDKHVTNVRGHWVPSREDGHSPWLTFEMATMNDQDKLRRVLSQMAVLSYQAITSARKRQKVETKNKEGETVYVKMAVLNTECRQGRHRSTLQALEIARQLRKLGFTVEITFVHLYMGVADYSTGEIDNRGPCGCHIDPWYCQYLDSRCADSYIREGKIAQADGHKLLDAMWKDINPPLLKLSGNDVLNHSTSPQPPSSSSCAPPAKARPKAKAPPPELRDLQPSKAPPMKATPKTHPVEPGTQVSNPHGMPCNCGQC